MAPRLLRRLTAPTPDADLLGRFVTARDEAAFAELVLVKGVYVEQSGVTPPDRAITGPMACGAEPADHLALGAAARALVAGGKAIRLAALFKGAVWHTPEPGAAGPSHPGDHGGRAVTG
jgi:hypothetical protein